jgi:predicted SAM-dependent methyltransferase
MTDQITDAIAKARDANTPPPSIVGIPTLPVELAVPEQYLKLDLACGQNIRAGFEGVDLPGVPGVHHEMNLARFPWKWADNSVGEINCSHFLEHLPMIYVDKHGNELPFGDPTGKDLFFAFFDECYRILRPEGTMVIVVPSCRSSRAFQDPTHRRFFPSEAFVYLNEGMRKANKLDHYNVVCNFDVAVDPGIFQHKAEQLHLMARLPEVRDQILDERWNVIADWHVKLRSLKPSPQIIAAAAAAAAIPPTP